MPYTTLESGIHIYDEESFKLLKESGLIASSILNTLLLSCKEGSTTQELEDLAIDLMKQFKVRSAFKDHEKYPFHTCLSVNEYLVHGFPNNRPLKKGDKISIDIGVVYKDHFSDNCRTIIVGGKEDSPHKELLDLTEASFNKGFEAAQCGNTTGDVGFAVNLEICNPKYKNKYKPCKSFQGHGIGHALHLAPSIPNIGFPGKGIELKEGMCFCIEPVIIYQQTEPVVYESIDYPGIFEFRSNNSMPGAHYENQVFITSNGPVILTHSS